MIAHTRAIEHVGALYLVRNDSKKRNMKKDEPIENVSRKKEDIKQDQEREVRKWLSVKHSHVEREKWVAYEIQFDVEPILTKFNISFPTKTLIKPGIA